MFECLCQEKEGAVWRSVHIPLVTVSWAMDMIGRLEKVDNFLPRTNRVGFMLDHKNAFLQIDEVGLIAIVPAHSDFLDVHITFWDGRLRGREKLCKTAASFVSSLMRKQLITVIPEDKQVLYFTNYRE